MARRLDIMIPATSAIDLREPEPQLQSGADMKTYFTEVQEDLQQRTESGKEVLFPRAETIKRVELII